MNFDQKICLNAKIQKMSYSNLVYLIFYRNITLLITKFLTNI